jgi:hypothetical protein
MKAIKYMLMLMCVVGLTTACEDNLDVAPTTEISSTNFYSNSVEMESAVNAVYSKLQSSQLYGYNYHFLMETRSDNTFEEEPSNSGGFGDIDLFNRNATNSVISGTWKHSYIAIQAANIVLNRIDAITDMDDATKKTRKGEVKFIRALVYFNLVRLYGDVPLVIKETVDPTDYFGQGRAPASEVYTQIIADLTQAAEELPNINEIGRATAGAANTLLGKVQLTNGNPLAAIDALRAVTGYSWITNYSDLFGIANENNAASIFEVQFQSGVNGNSEGSKFATLFTAQSNPGSKGNNLPTQDLSDSFEPGDKRRNELIPDAATPSLNISTKYLDSNQPQLEDGSNNVIVLRYADVLLMLAEALNEQGYVADGEAFTLLNQIRSRGALPALTSATVTNKAEFITALLEERRHEFFHETHRWFDLKRLGDPVTVMNNHFASIPGLNRIIDVDDLLLPIPQNQVDTDPEFIIQNPGYN